MFRFLSPPRSPLGRVPLALTVAASLCGCVEDETRTQWSEEQAAQWHADQPPLIGFNYAPRTAVNQLEMWQAATWDPDTIDQELGWAHDLGFNTARVFLHDLVWEEEQGAFLDRIDAFLDIAAGHEIRVMLVLFDGVWNPEPASGPQPDPTPGVHNSQWVQSPGAALLGDPSRHDELEPYVTALFEAFREDERVVVWDLFNEPDNPNAISYQDTDLDAEVKAERALQLLRSATEWAMAADPVQPLTAGVWDGDWSSADVLSPLNAFMLQEMDVNSFHSYSDASVVVEQLTQLKAFGRPLLCTEYMARPMDSTFETILPLFTRDRVGAYNWGFVDGRIQTIYSWTSWVLPSANEPNPWFHDVLRADGTPYDSAEIDAIQEFGW